MKLIPKYQNEAAKWLSKYATIAGVPITIKSNNYDNHSGRLGKKKC